MCLTSSQTSNSFICKSGLANWWKEISSVKKITLQPLERKKDLLMLLPFCRKKRWLNLTFNKITKCPLLGSMEGRRAYVVKFTSNRQAAGNSWCVWYPDKHSSIHTHNIFMHSILKHYKCVAKARKGMLSKSFSRFKNGTFLITIALVLILTGLSGLWTEETILSNWV